jgi:thiamine-monophosphate kinase
MADRLSGETLGEFERVRHFFAPLAGPGGLGLLDDAAIIDCRAGRRLVVTADAIVAGVHYLPDDPPDLIARKLLRVNLSDLAAMGARPLYYLLTTALSTALGSDWLAEFTRGLAEDQRRFGIDLLGGDSVATTGPAVLSLTAIGEVAAGMEVRRNDARAGDLVWVSGTIGDAFLGLALLRGAYPQLASEYRTGLIGRFQVPEPRVDLGCRLAGIAHAMIDISDGLIADLGHICETSRVAAVVELASLPLSRPARVIVDGEPGVRTTLAAGGDDYELLFTAPAGLTKAIDGLSSVLGLPITRIGRLEPGEGVGLVDAEGRTIPVSESGYRHF